MATQTTRTTAPTDRVVPRWTLADRLRKARLVHGSAQKEFAELLGVGASAYSQWEAGNNGPRDVVAIARRIELATRIPASWVLGLDDGPTDDDDRRWAPWGSNPRPAD